MDYAELYFTYKSTIPAELLNDVLAGELTDIGYEAFTETTDGLLAYIPIGKYNTETLNECLQSFPLEEVEFTYKQQVIQGKDWNEEWEKNYFKPVIIDNRCLIKASFHEVEETYEYTIIIDPKMAFGTGNHETTSLMLHEVLEADLSATSILDMGCGTAVLALLAEKRGAQRIVGIDIDPSAYENALENIKLNNSERVEIRLGGAEAVREGELFDVIFANINRNILLEDMAVYAKHLQPNGLLFLSGFYHDDSPVLIDACKQHGLVASEVGSSNDWAIIRAKRNNYS